MATTTILVVGKANTISAQLERIQRMGLVPSGPRIVERIDRQDIDAGAPGYTPGLSRQAVAS